MGHWDETLSANYNSGAEPALAGAQVAHAEYREGLHGNVADDGQVVNHGVVQSSSMDVLRQVGFGSRCISRPVKPLDILVRWSF